MPYTGMSTMRAHSWWGSPGQSQELCIEPPGQMQDLADIVTAEQRRIHLFQAPGKLDDTGRILSEPAHGIVCV